MNDNTKRKISVFPGSFDPLTLGHVDIIRRGLSIFDEIIVAVGTNTSKKYLFQANQRLEMVQIAFESEPRIKVKEFTGLTVDLCINEGAGTILRGLRNGLDFEYEESIAAMNRELQDQTETVLLFSSPDVAFISSTIVRELILNKGDISTFVPKEILEMVQRQYQ